MCPSMIHGLRKDVYKRQGKQCVTVFDYVVWPETMKDNRNQLAKPEKEDILTKLGQLQIVKEDYSFGDGHSAEKIVEYMEKCL